MTPIRPAFDPAFHPAFNDAQLDRDLTAILGANGTAEEILPVAKARRPFHATRVAHIAIALGVGSAVSVGAIVALMPDTPASHAGPTRERPSPVAAPPIHPDRQAVTPPSRMVPVASNAELPRRVAAAPVAAARAIVVDRRPGKTDDAVVSSALPRVEMAAQASARPMPSSSEVASLPVIPTTSAIEAVTATDTSPSARPADPPTASLPSQRVRRDSIDAIRALRRQ